MEKKPGVLFVDDEPEFLKTLLRTFHNDAHIAVEVASSAKDGLNLLDRNAYDIVISDWAMPEMDGGTFLTVVANRYPDVTRGLMTGVHDVTNIASAVNRSGVERVFLKPIDLAAMRATLYDMIPPGNPSVADASAPTKHNGTGGDTPVISIKSFVRGLLTVAQSIDPKLVAHLHRVASYGGELYALYMNRTNNPAPPSPAAVRSGRNTVVYAGLLHDIGKLFVDRRVLNKEFPLHESQQRLLEERIGILGKYLETRGAGDELAKSLIREITTILATDYRSRDRRNNLGRCVLSLSTLTKEIRREINLPLIDTEFTESLLEVNVGTLTPKERESVEYHTFYSERLASGIPWPHNLSQVPYLCRHHHERLDGSGYPDGVSGDERFTPELRVLSVADVYCAITDPDRTYRDPMSHDDAIEHLHDEAVAGRLDHNVVEAADRMGRL
ncbi:MAG: HD domain-containing phosphohydrolase [Alkalispirochaeta sp.]